MNAYLYRFLVRPAIVSSLLLSVGACGDGETENAGEAQQEQVQLNPMNNESETKASGALQKASQVAPEIEQKVLAKFRILRPDLEFSAVNTTDFPGLYEVEFTQGGVIYVSESGEHFISGELYKLADNGIANLTEASRVERRLEVLAELDRSQLITFPAEGANVKDVYVFTDVHCGYCAKLHNEVTELGKMGVRVNYLAYPRGGPRAQAYSIMQSVWCSDNPQKAITLAKQGKDIPSIQCDSTAVLDQFDLGNRMGVTGTPAIIFEDGTLMPGYRPAVELAYRAGATP